MLTIWLKPGEQTKKKVCDLWWDGELGCCVVQITDRTLNQKCVEKDPDHVSVTSQVLKERFIRLQGHYPNLWTLYNDRRWDRFLNALGDSVDRVEFEYRDNHGCSGDDGFYRHDGATLEVTSSGEYTPEESNPNHRTFVRADYKLHAPDWKGAQEIARLFQSGKLNSTTPSRDLSPA